MNSPSSILLRIREIEGTHPWQKNPQPPLIYAFGNRPEIKSIDTYAYIGIYINEMLRSAGVPVTSTGGIPALVVAGSAGNSQELRTNHKNNEQGGAEWTRRIRPKRT
jgi:hypothetical protein